MQLRAQKDRDDKHIDDAHNLHFANEMWATVEVMWDSKAAVASARIMIFIASQHVQVEGMPKQLYSLEAVRKHGCP